MAINWVICVSHKSKPNLYYIIQILNELQGGGGFSNKILTQSVLLQNLAVQPKYSSWACKRIQDSETLLTVSIECATRYPIFSMLSGPPYPMTEPSHINMSYIE